jgi:hypothetical protein
MSISMVMLSGPGSLSGKAVKQQLKQHWPDIGEVQVTSSDEQVVMLRINDSQIILGHMDVPIPWSELKGPCATTIFWDDAKEQVKSHQEHWIVTVNSELEPLELTILLSQVTAAVMDACPTAIGVYWGNATMIIPKEMFLESAYELLPEGRPLDIWIDVRLGAKDDGTCSAFTKGLSAFDLMEFETIAAPEKPMELREWLLSLSGYLIENGPVIKDGETVGRTPKEKVTVTYAPSKYGHKGKVMRLDFDAKPKRGWAFWRKS